MHAHAPKQQSYIRARWKLWLGIALILIIAVIVGVVINQFWVLMTVALAVSLGWLMAYAGNRARWNRPPDDTGAQL